jgi:hypothetical protein
MFETAEPAKCARQGELKSAFFRHSSEVAPRGEPSSALAPTRSASGWSPVSADPVAT